MNAHYLGTYKGKRYYRFTVEVRCNIGAHPGASDLTHQVTSEFEVISDSPTEALWLIKDVVGPKLPAPTEFTTWGPGRWVYLHHKTTPKPPRVRTAGKEHHHFMGWDSLIGAQMFRERSTYIQEEFKWHD